jgi:hypothetical protein
VSVRLPVSDGLEPEQGWRAWGLVRVPGSIQLSSPIVGSRRWPPRRPARARCERSGLSTHRAPDPGCTCGVYALARAEQLRFVRYPASVVGSVAMWGRVVQHASGYRAQFAYPQRLRVVCAMCLSEQTVSAPVQVLSDDGELVALCAIHIATAGALVPYGSVEGVQAELLERYAVDLLPFESLPMGGTRVVSSTRQRPPRRRERRARRSITSVIGALVAVRVLTAMLGGGFADDAVATPPAATHPLSASALIFDDRSSGDPPERSPRHKALPPVPHFRFLCGRTTGGWISVVDCADPGVGWISVVTFAKDQRADCLRTDVAVRLPDGRTRCWGRPPDVDVEESTG